MINKNEPIISVEGLSKAYTISHQNKTDYMTIKDQIFDKATHPFGKKTDSSRETFWALKDVSFDVNRGEVFAIVGRNGSGKSTLLKTLSRIIEPTEGRAIIRGKIASLLEVGTGFHPELSGRENIFFNGSMLGMSKSEIKKKFDTIVEFAEVEKFIDTPVRFYSSGMYVRLAFSVAAHLDPDVLILDEVLSVGDAAFQKKSLAKITATMEAGATVLFVSHSMSSVRQLCNRGILLKNGHVEFAGDIDELAETYIDSMQKDIAKISELKSTWEDKVADNDYIIPSKMYLVDDSNKVVKHPTSNIKDYWVTIEADVKQASEMLTIGIGIYNFHKTLIFSSYPSDMLKTMGTTLPKGKIKMRAKIPKYLLNSGKYKIALLGGIHNKFWIYEPNTPTPSFEMEVGESLISESPYWKHPREGLLAPKIDWEVDNV